MMFYDRDENAINKQKIEAKMKDMAGKRLAPRDKYDGNLNASTSSAVSPFSKISSTLSKDVEMFCLNYLKQ